MYYNKFKDISVSALGMGCLRLPAEEKDPNRIDREEAQKVIDRAISGGINFFDTAYIYQNGDSEIFLGEALSKYPRDSYYLSSKFYAVNEADIREVFQEQLRRCRTDHFDFYMLHGLDETYISAYMDKEKDYIGWLLEQKQAGRIRYLGFSSHAAPEALERFLDFYDGFDMALIQLNYLDWTMLEGERQYEILTRRGIPIWVMEPLKGGRLSEPGEETADILRSAAPERSLSSWGFRFLMGLPNVHTVLSGMSAVAQVEDNLKTFCRPDPLNEEESRALQQAAGVFIRELGVPCSGCRYCCSDCPAELDIPLLIKGYNEQNVAGETWRIAELAQTKGAEHCLQCNTCLKHCPQKIDIPKIMRMLSDK